MSLSSILSNTIESATEGIVVRVLSRIRYGCLTLRTPSSRTYVFPSPRGDDDVDAEGPTATITVRSSDFYLRLLTSGDLGFAEAYMFGDIDIDSNDLVNVFLIFIKNKDALSGLASSPLVDLLAVPARLIGRLSATVMKATGLTSMILDDARRNISAHYDLGNGMFEGFLSRDMTYSCAIFPTLDADLAQDFTQGSPVLSPSESGTPSSSSTATALDGIAEVAEYGGPKPGPDDLHEAQMRKLRHIIRKADIRPGHRILEIGSGWGSMSLLIARTIPGTNIDTITLSEQQLEYVQEKIRDMSQFAGILQEHAEDLNERVRVHLMDYRSMPPEWEGAFDRVISVEMVEAVGREYLQTYFATIDWALKKDTGVGVVQGITIPEARYEAYAKSEDFIRKWSTYTTRSSINITLTFTTQVFPGGILPTVTQLTNNVSVASQGRLVVDSVCNIGPHYARTLREWRRRFEAAFGEGGVIEEALKLEHPDTMGGPDGAAAIEVFRRKWIYYFCYCEAGFTTRALGDHIVAFSREGNEEYQCQVFS